MRNKTSLACGYQCVTLFVLGGQAEDAGESHAEELDRSKTKLDFRQVREGPATPKQMMCTSGQMSQCTKKDSSVLCGL